MPAEPARNRPAQAAGAGAGFRLSGMDLALLGVVVTWAGGYVGYRYGQMEMPTGIFNTLRFALALPVYWLILLRGREDWRISGAELPRMAVCGLVGVTLYGSLFALGVKYSTAANIALLLALSPVWTGIAGWITGRERPTWRFALGSAVGFAGAALVIGMGSGRLGFSSTTLRGDLIGLSASIIWGMYGPMAQPLLDRHSGVKVQAWMTLFGVLGFLALHGPALVLFDFGTVGRAGWWSIVYIALLVTAYGHVVWYTGIASVGANRVMLVMYLIPPAAILVGWLVLGESINPWQGVGAAVTLLGVWFIRRP